MKVAPRPPADALVALRSLGRRWRGLFAGLAADESPDDLAHRVGPDGPSALDYAAAATRTLSRLRRALEQVLVDGDAVLDAEVLDGGERAPATGTPGSVDDVIAALVTEADQLADRASRVSAHDWQRRARVTGHDTDVGALDVLWDAVDSAIVELKAAERTLREVRGRG